MRGTLVVRARASSGPGAWKSSRGVALECTEVTGVASTLFLRLPVGDRSIGHDRGGTGRSGRLPSGIAFGRDGKIYMTIGVPFRERPAGEVNAEDAQNPGSHAGKILRLNDDGSVPSDNPFAGRAGYRPEIYALGVRNALGLVVHPETGELWENENGPQGGDEINIIRPGRNYGWPVISYGRAYTGELTRAESGPTSDVPFAPGLEQPRRPGN